MISKKKKENHDDNNKQKIAIRIIIMTKTI